MRRFADAAGRSWDVVVGRESWGAFYALFVPVGRGRPEPVRQTLLEATAHDQAEREIEAMEEAGLRTLLDRSDEKSA